MSGLYSKLDNFVKKYGGADIETITKFTEFPANMFVEDLDVDVINIRYKWFALIIHNIILLGLFIYFLIIKYENGVTQSFISLDPNAGVCKSQSGSSTCCEVPVTITGTFLADTTGNWNTEAEFNYARSAYGMTVAGLSYTNTEYKEVLTSIKKKLKVIGDKSLTRDFAWNIIVLSSYAAVDLTHGSLKFYSTGDTGIIFDKAIYGAGIASSDLSCDLDWTSSYTSSSAQLQLSFNLNISYKNSKGDTEYNCPYNSAKGCENPCESAIGLNAFGYSKTSTYLDFSISMASVSTAVAVNYGLISLIDLVEVPGDNSRIDLLLRMNLTNIGIFKGLNTSSYYISSYYDVLYSPTDPIYCITYNDLKESQCLLRFGNTLVYPVVTSWGYYPSSKARVQQCRASAIKTSAGNYYCNLMDILVGFVYYPNAACDTKNKFVRRLEEDEDLIHDELIDKTYTEEVLLDKEFAELYLEDRELTNSSYGGSYGSYSGSYSGSSGSYGSYSGSYSSSSGSYYSSSSNSTSSSGSTTYYSSSYSSSTSTSNAYYSSSTTISFIPTNVCYDNGLIFSFIRALALARYNDSTNGDVFVVNKAYRALSDTVLNDYENLLTDFNKLCSGTEIVFGQLIPGGCAALAVEFYGGDDRHISEYYYQPSNIAFNDNIYLRNVLNNIINNPPTRLVQLYYDCVLSPVNSFFTSTGLAFSNASLYLMIAFTIIMYFLIRTLKFQKYDIKSKLQQKIVEDKEYKESQKMVQELIDLNAIEIIKALKKDIKTRNNTTFSNTLQTIAEGDQQRGNYGDVVVPVGEVNDGIELHNSKKTSAKVVPYA